MILKKEWHICLLAALLELVTLAPLRSFEDLRPPMFYIFLSFKYNLLCVAKLTRELNCCALFYPDFYIFQELFSGKVRGISRWENDLYLVNADCQLKYQGPQLNSTKDQDNAGNAVSSSKSLSTINTTQISMSLWHKRLSHAPFVVLRKLSCFKTLFTHTDELFTVCVLAKQSRLSFPLSNTTTTTCFYILHADVWGPYRVSTHDGKRYFLTLVDDYSTHTVDPTKLHI